MFSSVANDDTLDQTDLLVFVEMLEDTLDDLRTGYSAMVEESNRRAEAEYAARTGGA